MWYPWRDLDVSHTLGGCIPRSTTSTFTENTMVHTSTFRNHKDSSEKKKLFVPLSCCRNRVVFLFELVRECRMLSSRRNTTRAWEEYNMTVCAPGSDSILSQNIHMLTPGLPVFFSVTPTLVPVKVWSVL